MRIWDRNTVHFLPRIVPDRMELQEFAFQTVTNGVFPKLTKHKKKAWPKFPLYLDSLVLSNSTHAAMLGKEIIVMHLGEAPKRMHDPKSYLENLFAHERVRSQYVHENEHNDSMFRATMYFLQAMGKIEDLEVKSHLYKYQMETKDHTLHYRETKLKIE